MGQGQARPASEPQATAVAQTHVSAHDRVHLARQAHGALRCSCRPQPAAGRTWAATGGLSGSWAPSLQGGRTVRVTSTRGSQVGSASHPHEGRAVPEPKGDNSGRHRVQFFSFSYASPPSSKQSEFTLWNATSRCFSSRRGCGAGGRVLGGWRSHQCSPSPAPLRDHCPTQDDSDAEEDLVETEGCCSESVVLGAAEGP